MSMENKTARYLENVEVQYETEAQKEVIITALNDIMTLEESQLRVQKYPDYTGEESKWTVEEVLQRYFVPDLSSKHIDASFYDEIKKQVTKKQIKRLLEELK